MRRGDIILFSVTGALFAYCHFILFVATPITPYSGSSNNQLEIKKPADVLDTYGQLAIQGWSRHPYPIYNPQMEEEYPTCQSFQECFSLDPNHGRNILCGMKISAFLFPFLILIYVSNGFTVPTSELQFPTMGKHVELANNKYGVNAVISVSAEGHRTVQFSSPTFSANFTLKPSVDQEYLTVVAPIGSHNFYYTSKLYNSISEGTIKVEDDEPLSITADTFSKFDWNRGVYDYRSQWVQLGASMMLDGKRKLSLHFGTGLGNQSAASENAIIIDDKIYKLGHVNIDLMNPWLMTATEGETDMRIVFAPFVEFQTESSKSYVMLSNRVQQVFGKFLGNIILHNGEEVSLDDVTGCAELNFASW